jgi:hypothetical protein
MLIVESGTVESVANKIISQNYHCNIFGVVKVFFIIICHTRLRVFNILLCETFMSSK